MPIPVDVLSIQESGSPARIDSGGREEVHVTEEKFPMEYAPRKVAGSEGW